MSTERDELAEMLSQTRHVRALHLEIPSSMVTHVTYGVTDAVLADGYRRPRQVSSVEEVAALPVDSVIAGRPLRLDSTVGNIFCVADPELEEQAGLYVMGVEGVQPFDFIYDDLPATVLYEGSL